MLLIGDGMVDAYMWGHIARQSPEAPVPVVDVYHQEKRLGGAANVAINLNALGAKTLFCGFVGDDDNGLLFKNLMHQQGLSTSGLLEIKGRPTTVKTRIIAHGKHVLRIDQEVSDPLADYHEFIGSILGILQRETVDVILFQDYDKGVIAPEVIEAVVGIAKQKGIPTVVDPKNRNFLAYTDVTLFKPNLKEIKDGLSIQFNPRSETELRHAVKALREKLHADMVLLTLSELGAYVQHPETDALVPAFERNIVDVSGAGDTVVSVAALALASGCTPLEIAQLANLAGGLVCEKVGVVPIDRSRLKTETIQNLAK